MNLPAAPYAIPLGQAVGNLTLLDPDPPAGGRDQFVLMILISYSTPTKPTHILLVKDSLTSSLTVRLLKS